MPLRKPKLAKETVTLPRSGTITEAARLMRKHNIGDIIVVETGPGGAVPVGILTDRDIVVSVVASRTPLDAITVEDVMSENLIVAHKESSPADLISLMRVNGVKRIPIVDKSGYLCSVVSSDDLLEYISMELAGIAKMPERERKVERERRLNRA